MLLVALGATSTDGAIRRLGAARWNRLHMAVYAIAVLGAVHFFMQSKLDVTEPVLMAGLFLLLFAYRIAGRGGRSVTPLRMAGLSAVAALLTAGVEMAWYALATRVDPFLVLDANFTFVLGPRPAWWVLAAGLALAALAAVNPPAVPGGRRRALAAQAEGAGPPDGGPIARRAVALAGLGSPPPAAPPAGQGRLGRCARPISHLVAEKVSCRLA